MAGFRATHRWGFEAIGTRWEIQAPRPLTGPERARVRSVVDEFDAQWSRFRPDSVVSQLGRAGGSLPAPPDAADMLAAYAELSAATAEAVNPLVGAALERLGYDRAYSFRAGAPLPAPDGWRETLSVGDGRLVLGGPAVIDVGALGKGRLVDLVAAALPDDVAEHAVVDAGGDLLARGAPLRVGLEHPYDPSRAIGVWEVRDAALCASATNRRSWGDGLHHVLDARTGVPVRTVVATWAVGGDAMRADAVATALFFEGGPQLAHRWGVAWVRMLSSGRVEYSPGCAATLFTSADNVDS
ncbi:FAD:protein FMN transferase [Microbacterium sp. NPDC078428]|uniref:FAD:protein FMN transferase n=1 Tax=Microbacterium sp. NPDC078428 TaxID=3364190 RepID=UPI0037CA84E9